MRKKMLFGVVIGLSIALVGGVILMAIFRNKETVGTFKTADYSYFIENFSSEFLLDSIDSARSAKENAEAIWIEIFGESIKERRPYKVFFDDDNRVWLVQGTIPKSLVGGVPYILIQEDGKVLAVWHDK